jgi:predicted ATPase
MTPDRWRQVKVVFEAVRDLPESERAGAMDSQCKDAALRAEVESLLSHHDRARGFLDSSAARENTSTPEQLGRYEVKGVLGRGGMGVVYLARDPTLDRLVAIKVIPDEFDKNRERLMRFEREARLLASLNHPNIATVHGLEQVESGPRLLIMEHIEGRTLTAHLAAGALPLREALSMCMQVAVGLEAAHARGVVHRDLKPDNIRITPDGLVKILDFGLARRDAARDTRPGPPSSMPSMTTEPGLVMGTPGYMSPEQARGHAADERSDVFSFACILYACLTGHPPFKGDTPADCLASVLKDDPNLGALSPETPDLIRTLLARCLDKEPERRLPAMSHLRRELQAVLHDRPGSSLLTVARAAHASQIRTTNLPRAMTTFIGRSAEVTAISAALASTSLLTLTGAGGCGKTRLALRIAEDQVPAYDGVWLAELASTSDPALIPAVVAAAAGIKEEPGRSLPATLADRFAGRRVLIILDNCEHLLSGVGQLASELLQSCRELRILATSREALGIPGEVMWRVSSLSIPPEDTTSPDGLVAFESAQLFLDRARLVKPGLEVSASEVPVIARICRRLDGIPLALELAAARVKVLSFSQIHDKLSDRFRLLVGGAKAALERHQTLRAAIDWSYGLLLPEERRMLRALSVFAGGCSLEAAAGVCSTEADELGTLETLAHLVDKSLLIAEDTPGAQAPGAPVEVRYRLLETVRQYARDRLHAADDSPTEAGEVSDRHLDYFLNLAERAEPGLTSKDQSRWLDRLTVEHENLLAALDWCAGAGTGAVRDYNQIGLRLAGALARFWGIRGHLAIGTLAASRALARDSAPTEARAKALNSAGGLYYMQGDHGAAGEAWRETLDIQRALGNQRAQAGALNNLGLVAERQGELDRARGLYADALAVNRALDNRPWQAININNLANIAALQGDVDAAATGLREALRLNRELGNRAEEAKNLGNLGNVARDRADYAVARAYYADALKLKRDLGDRRGIGVTLSQVGLVEGLQSDFVSARRHLAEALTLLRDLGDKSGIATALEDTGCVASALGDVTRTGVLLGAAVAVRERMASPLVGGDLRRAGVAKAAARALDVAAYDAAQAAGREQPLVDVVQETLAWLSGAHSTPTATGIHPQTG